MSFFGDVANKMEHIAENGANGVLDIGKKLVESAKEIPSILGEKSPRISSPPFKDFPRATEWMKQYKDKKITDLFIPGSHDSATSNIGDKSLLQKALGARGWGPNWAKAQELDIGEQLEVGIRSLDFRVTKDENNKVYSCHGFISDLFLDDLNKIKDFVDKNKTEIVIVRVQGYSSKDDEELDVAFSQIKQVFDSRLISSADDSKENTVREQTIGQLTKEGSQGRVILSSQKIKDHKYIIFSEQTSWNKYQCVYPTDWANNYKKFLDTDEKENDYKDIDFLIMAGECTPDSGLIAQGETWMVGKIVELSGKGEQFTSLKDLADATNYVVLHFLTEHEKTIKDSRKLTITHDYVHPEIIKLIIGLNK
eukprot:77057_1